MLIIGLTGSIGMGKSTAAERFRANGIGVFDADAEVHALYRDGPAVARIEAAFPGTTHAGQVDRQRLLAALLATVGGFKRLEEIVHQMVRERERAFLHHEHERGARLAVLEIPLLFETGGDEFVDVTVVLTAPADVQRMRVLARPGMTEAKLAEMLSRQLPDAQKRARAGFIVDTSGPISETGAQIDKLIAQLSSRDGSAYHRHWA